MSQIEIDNNRILANQGLTDDENEDDKNTSKGKVSQQQQQQLQQQQSTNIQNSTKNNNIKYTDNVQNFLPYSKQEVEEYKVSYVKLQDFINEFNVRIGQLLRKSEDDFLHAYKEQMTKIQQELKSLKRKIDEETKKQKANDKMNILEEERDYFRAEALRLDKICKDQLRDIDELKFKMRILTEDKNYYEGFVIETKKENKALKSELLYLYKNKIQEKSNLKHDINNLQQEISAQIEDGASTTQRIKFEDQLQQQQQQQQQQSEQQQDNINEQPQLNHHQSESLFPSSIQKPQTATTSQPFYITSPEFNIPSSKVQNNRAVSHQQFQRNFKKTDNNQIESIQYNKNSEKKLLDTIKNLRTYIDKEKIINKKMKAELTQSNSLRSELEEVLLDCINEAKKDIGRRRLLQKEQALQNLRSSNGMVQQPQLNPFIEDDEIDYKKFSHKDKINLLKSYISSEQFLKQIYQITFEPNSLNNRAQSTSTRPQTQSTQFSQKRLQKSWKQDFQDASSLFNNQFKGFRYTFSAKSNVVSTKNVNKKDLSSTSYQFNIGTQDKINKIRNA